VAVTDLRNKLVAGAFSIAHVQHVVCAFGAVAVYTGAVPAGALAAAGPLRSAAPRCCRRAAASWGPRGLSRGAPRLVTATAPASPRPAAGSGRLVTLREVELPAQLEALFRRSLYKLALQVGVCGAAAAGLRAAAAAAGLRAAAAAAGLAAAGGQRCWLPALGAWALLEQPSEP
jgi:hypothetical protein